MRCRVSQAICSNMSLRLVLSVVARICCLLGVGLFGQWRSNQGFRCPLRWMDYRRISKLRQRGEIHDPGYGPYKFGGEGVRVNT